jgi:hypothetical protein
LSRRIRSKCRQWDVPAFAKCRDGGEAGLAAGDGGLCHGHQSSRGGLVLLGADAARLRIASDDIDIVDLLPQIRLPSLVIHAWHDHVAPLEQGRLLAARNPGARFVTVESENHVPVPDDPDAVATNRADAAILPAPYARELLLTGEARLLGWYLELDTQQPGALFASAGALQSRRPMVGRFLRAYRRGAADYAALLRNDSSSKCRSDEISERAATEIAHYVHPDLDGERARYVVEGAAYFMDAEARLDFADVARQVDW